MKENIVDDSSYIHVHVQPYNHNFFYMLQTKADVSSPRTGLNEGSADQKVGN